MITKGQQVVMRGVSNTVARIVSIFSIIALGNLYADSGLPNPSARAESQPKTIDIVADLIYWQTSEDIDWAFTLHSSSKSTYTSYQTLVFDWAPGFRIGLGYNMEHDRWDTQARYTWFQSKASASSNGPITPGFSAARLSLLEPFSAGDADMHLHYNMFDWDLGRMFFVSDHLLLRPFIGLKGGWITQAIHSHWTLLNFIGPYSLFAREDLKQKFIGGGPKGGVVSRWCLGNIKKHVFSIIGACEAGYLWGHWSIKDKYKDTLDTIIYTKTTPRNFASFMLHYWIGLGWDADFDRGRSHFGCKVGYEMEDWFNQCQIFSDINGAQNNDLILQGLNISVRFDF